MHPHKQTRTHVPVPESQFALDTLNTKDRLLDCVVPDVNIQRTMRATCNHLRKLAQKHRVFRSSSAPFFVLSAPWSSSFLCASHKQQCNCGTTATAGRRIVRSWQQFPHPWTGSLCSSRDRTPLGRGMTSRIAQGTAAPCAHHAKLRQQTMRAGCHVPESSYCANVLRQPFLGFDRPLPYISKLTSPASRPSLVMSIRNWAAPENVQSIPPLPMAV